MKKYRVWWTANMPAEAFFVPVDGPEEAKKMLELLTAYDMYLGSAVDTDAGGFECFDGEEWSEWYDDLGDDIWEWQK